MILIKYDILFNIYLLKNQDRFPFLILITRETYTYYLLYPIKLLKDIANDIIITIK